MLMGILEMTWIFSQLCFVFSFMQIRELRHELALLRTDYEELNNRLTELTYNTFEEIKNQHTDENDDNCEKDESPTQSPSEVAMEGNPEEDPLLNAVYIFEKEQALIEDWLDTEGYFGSVRSVAEGSVAEMCGIEDCDRLIAFGDLTTKTFKDLKQMADYFESMRGKRIEVPISVVL